MFLLHLFCIFLFGLLARAQCSTYDDAIEKEIESREHFFLIFTQKLTMLRDFESSVLASSRFLVQNELLFITR